MFLFCLQCKQIWTAVTHCTSTATRHAAWMIPTVQKASLHCPHKEKVPVMHKPTKGSVINGQWGKSLFPSAEDLGPFQPRLIPYHPAGLTTGNLHIFPPPLSTETTFQRKQQLHHHTQPPKLTQSPQNTQSAHLMEEEHPSYRISPKYSKCSLNGRRTSTIQDLPKILKVVT